MAEGWRKKVGSLFHLLAPFTIFVPELSRKIVKLARTLGTIVGILLLLFCGGKARAEYAPYRHGDRLVSADSIMEKVVFFAPLYERIVDSYNAELYIKGHIHIRKQNRLMRYIPTLFRMRKGEKEYLMETYNELSFTAPDIYDQKVTATMGTASEMWDLNGQLPQYFRINVYSASLLNDKLLSPLAPNAKKYYNYRIDTIQGKPHDLQYVIRFIPKSKSFQLVGGYMVVSDNVWSIREIRFSGRSEIFRFSNHVRMGQVGEADEFLPLYSDFDVTFKMVGNVIDGSYTAALKYKDIKQQNPSAYRRRAMEKESYDLSASYTLRCDTSASVKDTAAFNALRPLPLTKHEDSLYHSYYQYLDTAGQTRKKPRNKRLEFWGTVGDALVSRYTLDLANVGSVRCSPLINPLLLSYSHSNGISYRQDFRYNRLFPGDRFLHIAPRIGYNFTRKEFYWSMSGDLDYWPRKRAALHFEMGNGNRIYSSDVLDELKAMPDSLFDFDRIHLDYFKDLYFRVRHTWEIVNGLTLDIGLSIHRRTEVQKSEFRLNLPENNDLVSKRPQTRASIGENPYPPVLDSEFLKRFRHTYSSFAPRVSVQWTPGQYYYMNGDRKINLYSKYPTLSVDWERGISGILPGSGTYERVEVDLQHHVSLGLMRDLYYRVGWGKFTNQEELYFVDFANFTRHNLPVGWNDEIGGVFQLLDGRWYNSSRKYLRAHATYEAPFLLLRHLMKYTQYVLNERLYLNALVVPHLTPYLEVGYGIGTHIFDFGVFASFANWEYQEIGCKFTFELFNR